MPVDISPENEQFIQQQIEAGVFRTRTDAIDSGVELLRRRTELLDRIDWGRRQLDQGDYHEYDDDPCNSGSSNSSIARKAACAFRKKDEVIPACPASGRRSG
jgi:Arc/MetJ-type ribon-helix-helix transcriptional regulator